MASPIGHTLVGLTIARRLGVTSPAGLAAATVAASLPDLDIIAGIILHRDPWRLHRKLTHTAGFAFSTGVVAGLVGLVRAGSAEGERDLVADALSGAAIVGSHVLLDAMPFYLTDDDGTSAEMFTRNWWLNVAIDALLYGAFAAALWPRERRATES